MSTRLDSLVQATRDELARRKREVPERDLERRAAERSASRSFSDALRGPALALIAEHKRRSPSAGVIRAGASVSDVVGAYERGGASALSILTERQHFHGTLRDLAEARAATELPILRKDFTVDEYQLLEAAAWGADAVLLVVGALPPARLESLSESAQELSLDAIVEVHDERELDVALAAGATLLGVNNRNLEDFTVDIERTYELRARIPASCTVVSESGIFTREHVARLEHAGIDAVLVGEALMRADDAEAACRALLGA